MTSITELVTGQAGQAGGAPPMLTFTVELPDGREIDVEAPDRKSAAKAAKLFMDREGATKRIQGEQMQSPMFMGVDNAVRSFARGVPVVGGGMDEAAAGLNTGFGYLGDYDKELTYQRQRDAIYDQQHPWLSTGGQVAGGIAGSLAAGRYMPGGMLPQSMMGKIGVGTGVGTVLGGVEGFTRGEGGMANRAENAIPSSIMGAGFGGASPLVAAGAGAAWRGITSWLSNRGADAQSIQKIVGELTAAGVSPQQAEARLRQMGGEAMLADVSPSMQVMTGGTALADGGAGNMIAQRLANRRAGGQGRVARDLDAAFGPPRDPYSVREQTRTVQRGTGNTYQSAGTYEVNTIPLADYVHQQIQRVGRNGPLGRALHEAASYLVDESGDLVRRGDRIHAMREQLDMMIEQARNSGQGKLARAVGEIRSRVDRALKTGIPGFAQADRTFATAARQQEAFNQGRTEVLRGGSNTMTPDQLRALQAQSSAPENIMRRQGVRTELDRIMSNQRRDPAVTIDRVTSRDWNRQKIGAMIGPQPAQRLANNLDREATFTQTSNLAEPGRNSRTAVIGDAAARLWGPSGAGKAIRDTIGSGVVGTALGGPAAGVSAAATTGARALHKSLGGGISQKTMRIIRATADRLTATGPARQAVMTEIIQAVARLPRQNQTAAAIERITRNVMIGQSGRAGYESQRLALPYLGGR